MEILLQKIAVYLAILIFAIRYLSIKDKIPFALYFYIVTIPYNTTIVTYFPLIDKIIEFLLLLTALYYIINNNFIIYMDQYLLFYLISLLISVLSLSFRLLDFQVLIHNADLRFIIGIFIVSIILYNTIKTLKQCYQILEIFSINALIIALGGIAVCWSKDYQLGEIRLNFILGINPSAIFLFVGVLITFFTTVLSNKKDLKKYVKAIFSISIIGIACLCTKSSAIYMSFAFVFLLAIVYLLRIQDYILAKWCIGMLLTLSICAIGMILLEDCTPFLQRPLELLGRGLDTERLQIWRTAFSSFMSHPLFGIGKSLFVNVNEFNFASHNDFLKILAETGITGIITFCMYLYSVFKSCFHLKSRLETLFALSLFWGMIIYMLTHNYIIYAIFWVLTFIIKKMYMIENASDNVRRNSIYRKEYIK